ncbi:hypothetical protein ABT218_33035 [Streptomyces sp. NPDC001455]|uniref:hypothetical protein n=1 Tax=Streptomyces sp. NPDC001455 TaxID=3154518 RepID=UPI00332791AE
MPSRRRNENLRALLGEARWTQAALARTVNALGAEIDLELHYDRTAVAYWLRGTRPAQPVPDLIAEAFTRRLGRAVPLAAAGFADDLGGAWGDRLGGFRTPVGTWLTELCSLESDPARRADARLLPYREAELARSARSAAPEPEPETADGADGAEGGLGVVRLAVRFFSASFDAHGGQGARSSLAAYLADDIAPLLREGGDGARRRALLVEASRLTFLLARMHQDAAAHGLAQQHFTTALRLADASGDTTARAVVLRGLSAQGLALGHRKNALRAAEAAAACPGASDGPARAFLLSQLAVAQAACGRHRSARVSLTRAEEALATGAGCGAAEPFDAYSSGSLEFQRSEVLRYTGDLPAARSALANSLARRPSADHRGMALSHAQLGEILIGLGYVEESCVSWNSFLDHYAVLRSGAADQAAGRMRKLLTPFRKVPAAHVVLQRARVVAAPSGRA